jgi:hypothetical protein
VPGRRERDAEPRPRGLLAAGERVDAVAHGTVGRHGEDQAAVAADGVEAEQAPRRVDERPARGAARERRRVLDRAADPPAPGTAEGAPVADTSPNVVRSPRPLGSASARTGIPSDAALAASGSQVTVAASPVSTATTARSRSASVPATRPCSVRPPANVTATSPPRSTCAHVRTRPGLVDHAGAAAPSAAEAHDRRPHPPGRLDDRLLKCFENVHDRYLHR